MAIKQEASIFKLPASIGQNAVNQTPSYPGNAVLTERDNSRQVQLGGQINALGAIIPIPRRTDGVRVKPDKLYATGLSGHVKLFGGIEEKYSDLQLTDVALQLLTETTQGADGKPVKISHNPVITGPRLHLKFPGDTLILRGAMTYDSRVKEAGLNLGWRIGGFDRVGADGKLISSISGARFGMSIEGLKVDRTTSARIDALSANGGPVAVALMQPNEAGQAEPVAAMTFDIARGPLQIGSRRENNGWSVGFRMETTLAGGNFVGPDKIEHFMGLLDAGLSFAMSSQRDLREISVSADSMRLTGLESDTFRFGHD